MIGAISGCLPGEFEMDPDDTGTSELMIHLDGWSPSLNRIEMAWRAGKVPDMAAGDQAEYLLASLTRHMAVQRQRLAHGLTLGTATPFGIASMDGGARADTQCEHIRLDRGLAALMAEQGQLAWDVTDSVFDLHQSDNGIYDGLEGVIDARVMDDNGDPIGLHRLEGTTLSRDVRVGAALYDGRRLIVNQRIPETLLTAATGRPLGTLADVPAAIAGHIVARGVVGSAGTEVFVEPRLATLAELRAEEEAPTSR